MIARIPIGLALVCVAASAGADPVPATARLAWVRGDGADTCPDGAWLRDEVTRRMRRDPFDDDGPRAIEGIVERVENTWRATLRVRDREGALRGERTLTDDTSSCARISDAAALAIALAVDPDAVIDAPSPLPRPPRPRVRVLRVPAAPNADDALPPPVAVELRAGVVAGIATEAAPVVGLTGELSLSARWSLRLRAEIAPARSTDDGILAVGFSRGSLDVCGTPWRATRWALLTCAGLSAAAVHVSVRSGRALDGGDSPWLGAVAAVGLRWSPTARWFVGVEVEGAVALLRSAFRYRPDDAVIAAQPALGGGAALALGIRAP